MRPRYKVTGCARFFFFFILFVPAVFFGAAYFRGENGVQILKEFFQDLTGGSDSKSSPDRDDTDTYNTQDLQRELKKVREENRALKEKIEDQEEEIKRLREGG